MPADCFLRPTRPWPAGAWESSVGRAPELMGRWVSFGRASDFERPSTDQREVMRAPHTFMLGLAHGGIAAVGIVEIRDGVRLRRQEVDFACIVGD